MTNEVFNDYIERKKVEFDELWVDKSPRSYFHLFIDNMAQEIFGALPEEATMDKEERELNDLVHTTERQYDINLGHNFCRSTFLENIKKLK